MKSLLTNLILIGMSALIALFVVRVFDDWHQDRQEARAERRRREEGRRYE